MGKLEIDGSEIPALANALETLNAAGVQDISIKWDEESDPRIHIAVATFSHGFEVEAAFSPAIAIVKLGERWVEDMKAAVEEQRRLSDVK